MRLLDFKARGIFSLGDVGLTLTHRGLVLVTGYSKDDGKSNGAGKSNLINKGILWTLFGSTGQGLKADKVVNRHIVDNNKVFGQISFVGRDGNTYTIYRQRNPAELRLTMNQQDISLRHERETQNKINKILGFDLKSFCFTSIYGQGINNNFINLTPSEKMELIKSLLPLPKLEEWHEKAKIAKSEVEEKLQETNHLIKSKVSSKDELQIQLDSLKKKEIAWEKDKADKINKLSQEIKIGFQEAKGAKKRISELENLIEGFTTYPETYEQELLDKKQKLKEKKSELEQKSISIEKQISSLELKYSVLEAKILPLKKEDKTCPTCGQIIVDQVFETLMEDQEKIKDEMLKLSTEISSLKSSLDDPVTSSAIQDIKTEISAIESLLATVASEKLEKLKLEKELESLRNKSNLDIEIKKAKLAELSKSTNPYTGSISQMETRIKELDETISDLNKKLDQYKAELEKVSFWEKAYGKQLKQKMLGVVCPYLNNRVKFHLMELGNPQFKVEFTIIKELASGAKKEEFNVQVESVTGGSGFDSLSGGEQSIVNFAVGMALSDLASSQVNEGSNIMILDEPFVELDQVNVENVLNHLKNNISKSRESVFLVSNDEGFKSLIPNHIRVVKSGGVTNIDSP